MCATLGIVQSGALYTVQYCKSLRLEKLQYEDCTRLDKISVGASYSWGDHSHLQYASKCAA